MKNNEPYSKKEANEIQDMRDDLSLNNSMLAKFFGYKSLNSFNTTSAKRGLMRGLLKFYKHIINIR